MKKVEDIISFRKKSIEELFRLYDVFNNKSKENIEFLSSSFIDNLFNKAVNSSLETHSVSYDIKIKCSFVTLIRELISAKDPDLYKLMSDCVDFDEIKKEFDEVTLKSFMDFPMLYKNFYTCIYEEKLYLVNIEDLKNKLESLGTKYHFGMYDLGVSLDIPYISEDMLIKSK